MNEDKFERWEILVLETAEEYLEKKRIRRKQLDKEIELYLLSEKNDCCEGDCTGKRCRVVFGDMYLCYDCFYHSLDCEASIMVPSYHVDQMREYVDEDIWDALWEEEHGFI